MATKNWIASAVKNKWGLHKSLWVPMWKKIPMKMIEEAANEWEGKLQKQAILARTLAKLRK